MRVLLGLITIFLLCACADGGINNEEELAAVSGSYFAHIKLNEDHKLDLQLQLKPNGFYVISHQDLSGGSELIRENGVFLLKDGEVELARKQVGFRYFKVVEKKLFVYNLFHEPYTNFSDSSFYLRRQY